MSSSMSNLNVSGDVSDAVIGDSILAEVVGSDPLWLMPRAHLCSQTRLKALRLKNMCNFHPPDPSPAASEPCVSARCLYPACSDRAWLSACAWPCLCSAAASDSAGTQLLLLLAVNNKTSWQQAGQQTNPFWLVVPVGRWTIRTALSVVLTLCPPAPRDLNVSIRRSLGSMWTSNCEQKQSFV